VARDYSYIFDSLENEYRSNIDGYIKWSSNANGILRDCANNHGVSCLGGVKVYSQENSGNFIEVDSLFIGPRGLVYSDKTTQTFLVFSSFHKVFYDIEDQKYFKVLSLRCHQAFISFNVTFLIYQSSLIPEITALLDQRNEFVNRFTEIVFGSLLDQYSVCENSDELNDIVSNCYDMLPDSLFFVPAAYYHFTMNLADSCLNFYFIPTGVNEDEINSENTSSFDFERLNQIATDFCEYLETEYNVRTWASHTLVYILFRQETIKRSVFRLKQEYGIVLDDNDIEHLVSQNLESGAMLPDDTIGVMLLAWASLRDDDFATIFKRLPIVKEIVKSFKDNNRKLAFKSALTRKATIQSNSNAPSRLTIDDIDLMTGIEFEEFLAALFSKMGFQVALTKNSGDQGIDIIAEKGNQRIGIQAKCYSGSVGNASVQEAVAGKSYYNLTKALVITNSRFTSSAKELAQANNVLLWDRDIVIEKLSEYCQ
jgi:HJR/Mrr/RecB family endonuclease